MRFGKFHKPALVLFVLGVIGVLAGSVWAKPAKKGEEVVALVNGKPIIAATVQMEINGVLARFQEQGRKPNEAETASLREAVLDKVVKLELLSQESKKAGIVAKSAEIDNELKGYKKSFPDDRAFVKALDQAGVTEAELRKQIAKNLAIQKFIDTRFKQKVKITEQEAKVFYDGNQDKFAQPELAHARHILITVKETDSKAEKDSKRAKLVQIKKQLKDGAGFDELAKQSSDCPSKTQGGDLGFFPRGQMVKPFEEAVFKMKPGEVSDIVETQFGYHLIKLEEKKPAKTVSFDEAKGKIISFLSQQKITADIEAFLAEVKGKSTIKILSPQAKK